MGGGDGLRIPGAVVRSRRPARRDSGTGMVLLAHSVKWDLENPGGVRIKPSAFCVRNSGKWPARGAAHRKYQVC